ncbi:MAG: hypothetical protein QOH83_2097 [Solirubrobacteraceae bacterium]|jgi:hypothetical protein|nr:hypothetical protein [Solirubrobacteraceae bacterium]
MTRVELHIERLVLDGVSLGPGGERALLGALEARLTQLVAASAAGQPIEGGSLARVRATPMTLAGGADAASLGRGLADAVHRSLPGESGR